MLNLLKPLDLAVFKIVGSSEDNLFFIALSIKSPGSIVLSDYKST